MDDEHSVPDVRSLPLASCLIPEQLAVIRLNWYWMLSATRLPPSSLAETNVSRSQDTRFWANHSLWEFSSWTHWFKVLTNTLSTSNTLQTSETPSIDLINLHWVPNPEDVSHAEGSEWSADCSSDQPLPCCDVENSYSTAGHIFSWIKSSHQPLGPFEVSKM